MDRRFYEPLDSALYNVLYPIPSCPSAPRADLSNGLVGVDDKRNVQNAIMNISQNENTMLPMIDLTCGSDNDDDVVPIDEDIAECSVSSDSNSVATRAAVKNVVQRSKKASPTSATGVMPKAELRSKRRSNQNATSAEGTNDASAVDIYAASTSKDYSISRPVTAMDEPSTSTGFTSLSNRNENYQNDDATMLRRRKIIKGRSSLHSLIQRFQKSLEQGAYLRKQYPGDMPRKVHRRFWNPLRGPEKPDVLGLTNGHSHFFMQNSSNRNAAANGATSPTLSVASTSQITKPATVKKITDKPKSAPHSNASSDSAIGESNKTNSRPVINFPIMDPFEIRPPEKNKLDMVSVPQTQNPFNEADGPILGAFVAVAERNNEIIIVIQERMVAFWRMTPRVFTVFGIPRACALIGKLKRDQTGKRSPHTSHSDQ